jgi:hypothetical protein
VWCFVSILWKESNWGAAFFPIFRSVSQSFSRILSIIHCWPLLAGGEGRTNKKANPHNHQTKQWMKLIHIAALKGERHKNCWQHCGRQGNRCARNKQQKIENEKSSKNRGQERDGCFVCICKF